MRLEACTFTRNTGGRALVADNRNTPEADVLFYGDDVTPQVCTWAYDTTSSFINPKCQLSIALPLDLAGPEFLTGGDEWLLAAQKVRGKPMAGGGAER